MFCRHAYCVYQTYSCGKARLQIFFKNCSARMVIRFTTYGKAKRSRCLLLTTVLERRHYLLPVALHLKVSLLILYNCTWKASLLFLMRPLNRCCCSLLVTSTGRLHSFITCSFPDGCSAVFEVIHSVLLRHLWLPFQWLCTQSSDFLERMLLLFMAERWRS